MNKAFITGADGFMGRHLIRKLIEKQVDVVAIVHPDSPNKHMYDNDKSITVIEASLDYMIDHFNDYCDAINSDDTGDVYDAMFYHFAWDGVNATDRNNMEVQQKNLKLCEQAVELAKLLKVKKFLYPGSTNEYLYCGSLINKDAIPTPSDAYGIVKISAKKTVWDKCKEYNIDFVYAVIAGTYAADRKDNNVIFYTIDSLLKHEKPSLTSLEQNWDYVHIDDAVEALYLLGDSGKDGRFYAIGKGDNQPLYKYIEAIRDNIDKNLPLGIGEVPYQRDVLPMSCVDLTAIHDDTGFIPRIEFKDGIKEVINMLRNESIV